MSDTVDLHQISRQYGLPLSNVRMTLLVPGGEIVCWHDRLAFTTCRCPDSWRSFPRGRVEYLNRLTAGLTFSFEPRDVGQMIEALHRMDWSSPRTTEER